MKGHLFQTSWPILVRCRNRSKNLGFGGFALKAWLFKVYFAILSAGRKVLDKPRIWRILSERCGFTTAILHLLCWQKVLDW